MKILAVETATALQSVALLDGERVLAHAELQAHGAHARWLMPTIDRLLREAGQAVKDLEGLAVSIGPGSFTGLRVGLATMLGFRLVTGLPLATVPTLEGMAWNLRGMRRPICPVVKEVYWAVYRWLDGADSTVEQVTEERVGPPSELAKAVLQSVVGAPAGLLKDAGCGAPTSSPGSKHSADH
jgi:tRNA threonylcarbamoyladenosine biosynthesis protein TsaB